MITRTALFIYLFVYSFILFYLLTRTALFISLFISKDYVIYLYIYVIYLFIIIFFKKIHQFCLVANLVHVF